MEMLEGQHIGLLPFKGLKKISDLIFYDGPILSHFKDEYGSDVLFYWVDFSEEHNRWLVFQVSKDQLNQYLLQKKSLKQLIDEPFNNVLYSIEINEQLSFDNSYVLFKGNLPQSYLPEGDSFFSFPIPKTYDGQLKAYQENMLLESMKDKGIYMKANPTSSANSNLVSAMDGGQLLFNVGTSFKEFVKLAARKKLISKNIIGRKATTIINNLLDNFKPNIIEAQIASFAIGLSPNSIVSTPETFFDRVWMEEVTADFKREVIDIDIRNEENIASIVNRFEDNVRHDIYKPIIELYKNENINIEITDKVFEPIRQIKRIAEDKEQKLLYKNVPDKKVSIETKRLAFVNYDEQKQKPVSIITGSVFEQNIAPGWGKDEILSTNKIYKLRRKILAEYINDGGKHILENEELGIYAIGDDLSEAERNFYDEFDYLYNRYNSFLDTQLTDDVLLIKHIINSLVINQ